ncbi:unannotated protein [freshwater metagenome]|uniref:Unannotated protein n=1 Tax=freshwater metagenome TaxID=449393 RepID=A0A6J7K933_9ZZZZ|nr:hypothetical protein [Actinomycetota bacterium]
MNRSHAQSRRNSQQNKITRMNGRSLFSRLPFGVFLVGVGSFMALSAASTGAGASIAIDLDNPLGAAQDAALSHSYDATLTTTWLSQGGLRTRRITVNANGERVSVDGERKLLSSGSLRAVQRGGSWRSIWTTPETLRGPALTKKYVATLGGSSTVAGRATTQVVIADRRGRLRDLIDIDSENGLMLRREQRDERGETLRITAFEKISVMNEAEQSPGMPKPGATTPGGVKPTKSKDASAAPRAALTVESPFMVFRRLPGGFTLVGKYLAQGNGRELFYSDGLNSVSVFEWEGSIEPGSLPAGGKWHRAPNGEMRSYDSPVGIVSVWDADGMTFTVVSEATALETARIVAALPQDTKTEGFERISRFLVGPFSWG